MSEKLEDDLLLVLEKGIRSVLENKDSTSKEKMDAINAGTKLLHLKHKIKDTDDEPGSFFGKKP